MYSTHNKQEKKLPILFIQEEELFFDESTSNKKRSKNLPTSHQNYTLQKRFYLIFSYTVKQLLKAQGPQNTTKPWVWYKN